MNDTALRHGKMWVINNYITVKLLGTLVEIVSLPMIKSGYTSD